jgi:MFS family permease
MSGHKVLIVVSLAAALLMVGVGMIVALLPQRVLDFSGSLQNVGYVASAFALSYLILQLPIGNLADRLGAKPFLVLGYALCCISGIVFFHAGTSEMIFLGRFIQGAGEAPVWALGPALLSLAYPHAKG